eukprot:TRINITY_DN3929_c0_g1_i1.p1 TRINITY_DN3929_c0_g1~~TRINITY_DN3929_c0_g1_i1.p1  ORF type:complete len:785 (+),score=106.06 TRINITY_DN3929_c0_g1_i1:281-2356(+)
MCSTFAGVYVTSGVSCASPNFYTAECTCPSGSVAQCITFDTPVSQLCFCEWESAQSQDYGGAFGTTTDGECPNPNPMTGACSCPAGFESTETLNFPVINIQICTGQNAKTSPVASFAGFYETSPKGACVLPNGFSGDCTCPTSLNNGLLTSCPSSATTNINSVTFCSATPNTKGVEVSLTTVGITSLAAGALNQTIQNSQDLQLPDISGHDYKVEGLSFHYLGFEDIVVKPLGNSVFLYLSGGKMLGSISKIEAHKGIFKTHCDCHPLDIYDVSITAEIVASLNFYGGIPQIALEAIPSATASCGGIDADVHGNAICDVLKKLIEDDIKKGIEENFPTLVPQQLTATLESLATTMNQELSSYPTYFQVVTTELSYPLFVDFAPTTCSAALNFDASVAALAVPFKGGFFAQNIPMSFVEAPFTSSFVPPAVPSTRDAQACFGEYVPDSLGWLLYETGVFNHNITNQDLPEGAPFSLNTSNTIIDQIAPGIAKTYPNCAMIIVVACSADAPNTTYPKATYLDNGVMLTFDTLVSFRVLSNSNEDPDNCIFDSALGTNVCRAFDLQMSLELSLSVTLAEAPTTLTLSTSATNLSVSWNVVESNVGQISTFMFGFLDQILVPMALKNVNSVLAETSFVYPKQVSTLVTSDFTQIQFYPAADGQGSCCVDFNIQLVAEDFVKMLKSNLKGKPVVIN